MVDFSYLDNKKYAFTPLTYDQANARDVFMTKGRNGEMIFTDKTLIKTKDVCLDLIESNPDITFKVYGGGILYKDGLNNLQYGEY